jgi:hypothetical protein
MKLRRVIICCGVSAAVTVLIVIFSALVLPRLIDSQLVKEKIGSLLSEKTGGHLTLGKIELQWFPRLVVVIENAAFSIDKSQGAIQAIRVYPSILHLLSGRVVVSRLRLQEPRVKIRLPLLEEAFVVEEWENNLRAALTQLATELPALRIELSDGWAEISMGDSAPATLENLEARALGSAQDLSFQLSARSNLCAGFRLEGRIAHESLAANLAVAVQQLKLAESFARLPFRVFAQAQKGQASFDLKADTVGLRQIKAEIDGSVSALVLARRGGSARLDAKKLKGNLDYKDGRIQANLEQLELASPRLHASGELTATPAFSSARIRFRDIDIAEIRDLALRTVDDLAAVKKVFQFVEAGIIPEMLFQSGASSFAAMAAAKNVALSGVIRNSKIVIPGRDLELTDVSATVRLVNAVLEAKDLASNLGRIKGWNGNLKLGLEGKTAPFHLDIELRAAAAELQAALLKLVDQENFRRELLKVHDLDGELSGRVVLGERLDALSSVVSVSKSDVSGTYEPIPYSIAVKGGRFDYDPSAFRLQNVHGAVGRSNVTGLSATLRNDRERSLSIDAAQISLDLEEADASLRRLEKRPSYLDKLQSARGRVQLGRLNLSGALNHPAAQWRLTSSGEVKQVVITHDELAGPLNVAGGKFTATEERIAFSDAVVEMLDASVAAHGVLELTKGSPLKLEAAGTATLGAEAGQWLSHRIELSKKLVPRYPLKIAAERIAWQAAGDVSFRGQATVAGGAQVFLDATRSPQGAAAGDLSMQDGARNARMTFQLDKDNNIDLSFKGALTGETLAQIFTAFPAQVGALQGDIQASASLTRPRQFSARGELEGSNLSLSLEGERTLVERFRIEADGRNVLVRGADLRLGNSRLKVSGNAAGGDDALRLDMDVYGDGLNWEDLKRSVGRGGAAARDRNEVPFPLPLEGIVRLQSNSFIFEGFDFNPLEMTAFLSSSGIRSEITRAVACGVEATGLLDLGHKEIALDIQLAATDAQLEPASVCFLGQEHNARGVYSLKARIVGKGESDRFLTALKGKFEVNARDGEFVRAPGIDATFDYLNQTGDFKVAFPDLNKETFPYRLVSVSGSIDGAVVAVDEVVVQSPLINLSGQGRIDLARKQIDGKGLIAVLRPVEEVLGRIPVVGSIFGGSIIGIPVRVTGPLERPEVTYLSPTDVGAELLNIPVRILGIPFGAMKLFTPGNGESRERSNQ